MRAYIGVGTNLGCREDNITAARESLELVPGTHVLRTAGIIETEPVGYSEQGMFLNTVFEIETTLSPHALLGACLGIEAAMGRVRTVKNGPRVIDLDVLLCEGFTSDCAELRVPHPEMLKRSFVMIPLKELLSDGEIEQLSQKSNVSE